MDSTNHRAEHNKIVSREVVAEMRWLRLVQLKYTDDVGVVRPWEAVERTTRQPSCEFDAAEVCAIRVSTCEAGAIEKEVLLVEQFRAPVGRKSIEFPAGLVDAGEGAAEAALRELKEETGYVGTVTHVGPSCSYDPGLSASRMAFITVAVDMSNPANMTPQPHTEDGEYVSCHWVPLRRLLAKLREFADAGYNVDAKLYTFAVGLSIEPTNSDR